MTSYSVVCPQRMLEELEDISLRVDNVRDQAIILMTSRGPACRDVVEPKLAELNCNFDKVSQHIKTAKVQKHRLYVNLKSMYAQCSVEFNPAIHKKRVKRSNRKHVV